MVLLLQLFVFIPFFGFIISLCVPEKNEKIISWVTFITVGLHFLSFLIFLGFWLLNHHITLNMKEIVLFRTSGYEFFIDFYFDKIGAVYLSVGAFLTFLISVYSKDYLHRESGYKRFFNTILFFYMGYNIVILSGNLETLFLGWEILGIASFLLIAFYRDRYLPVKNAVKVFSIYRIGDVGLLLAMWMSHHLWHENITFLKLHNDSLVNTHLENHSLIGIFISVMILVSAAAKSAQLPFSSWLPKAMEGPTPSSAIFYGSLSVHLGVFLLLRTFPFWEHQLSVRILIGLLGLTTSIIASSMAHVQSSVKSQIAYSSVGQIGIIFIEVALGFVDLALIHFASNAFLRTYQLLVSPSVVTYLIREQFYNVLPARKSVMGYLPQKLRYSVYVLSLKEWNLDNLLYFLYWNPLKRAGNILNFLSVSRAFYLFIPTYLIGLICLYNESSIPASLYHNFPIVFSLIGLLLVVKSFAERKSAQVSWLLVIMSHFWIALAVSFNEHFNINQSLLYLSGIVMAGIAGYACLSKLQSMEANVTLERFQGHSYEHPKLAVFFMLCCLGLTGFPITPTFIGEDLIFSHIHEDQLMLALIVSSCFIIDGLAIIRIYARVFLGPHIKTYHESSYKSS
ncbi:MAG: hypothetical protein H7259_07540 [Cytophagales bacterium]|nr:hypothetical protein [Cytophaga sp.]